MIKPNFLTSAIQSFCDGKPGMFHFAGPESYENLIWETDEYPQPSEQEVSNKLVELDAAWEQSQYQRHRALEYPPITDYLDGVVKGDQAQIDAYIAACQAVKDKYPKV
jgi:hypothetical protein